ncbi:MAG: cellulose-binding protein [Cyanobacteria bacterium]|jgi:hypothetical protein|nr:cellulose-binding protein [Cyanobacteria bacterium GSL.Bin1]
MIKLRRLFLIFTVALSLVLIASFLTKGFNSFQTTVKQDIDNKIYLSSQSKVETNIGTNLNSINDWSSQLPFRDGFHSSRPWLPQKSGVWNTNESDQLDLDANGWVKSLPSPKDSTEYTYVGTLLFRELEGNYPGGEYVVLYEGEGTIEYDFDATRVPAASSPGRDVIRVNPSNSGIYLKITETDPNQTGNYLRQIRVLPVTSENSDPSALFNPTFIEKIQPFAAFRFMDWMKTNNSTQKEWSHRPTLEDATWSQAGAPVEIMVELANRTDSDPWFTIPHQATDEYVINFASYVRDHLDPDLKVYVEYSNEVWNSQFEQAQWVQKQAQQEWGEGGYGKGLEWFGKRTTEITRLWDEVFGPEKERVIGVMGAQAANPWTAQKALNYQAWAESPLSHAEYGIDAIAIAPYFGSLGKPAHETVVESWTTEADGGLSKLFDELSQGGILPDGPPGGALQQAYQNMQNYVELAEQEQLQLLAYEGGQHLVGRGGVENNTAVTKLFIEANRDPRMGELYREYLSQWQELGGGLFVNFSDIGQASKWGSWGVLEYVNQESSPKYDALIDLIHSR